MSLRSTLEPRVAELLTSRRTRDLRRRVVELTRWLRGQPHHVHYFHQVDDPYSHLCAQLLESLVERYDIELDVHLVGPPADAAAPDRERLVAYSRVDAERVADARGLAYRDPGAQPSAALVDLASRVLASVRSPRAFASLAPRVGEALWDGDEETLRALARDQPGAATVNVAAVVAKGDALRASLGHYLGAVFCYGGESYWGVDRLGYLEKRLIGLGARRDADGMLLAPRIDVQGDAIDARGAGMTLEYFVSLRSPYSYISMPRTFDLAARTGVTLKLRPVLPMVMRGLPVPAAKRWYITLDTKREADSIGVPFGRIADPVGRPVERAFSLYPYVDSRGHAADFLLAFCRAAFAEGVQTGTDEGLRYVVEVAGLPWAETLRHADTDGWRTELEANREDMLALGLWGVPSYRLRGPEGTPDFTTWGQDRLRQIEDEIRRRAAAPPA
jgi:2-hydroxychromene-2-carboxylate isomerase